MSLFLGEFRLKADFLFNFTLKIYFLEKSALRGNDAEFAKKFVILEKEFILSENWNDNGRKKV